MDSLKGMTIFIGRDPEQGRLLVALGNGKSLTLGNACSVPSSVSRCKPSEGIAHSKIEIGKNGDIILTNLKSGNVTFVNGVTVASKHIDLSSTVELGKDHYKVNIEAILESAKKLTAIGGAQKKTQKYDIKHLEEVWNGYHDALKKMRERQKRINLIRSGCGIFTMCAMPCIFFLGPVGYALTGIGVAGNIYTFVGLKNDNTTDEQERLTEDFQDHYVCPNPDCRKFLGNLSYKLLKRQYSMHCPYCKCEFTE